MAEASSEEGERGELRSRQLVNACDPSPSVSHMDAASGRRPSEISLYAHSEHPLLLTGRARDSMSDSGDMVGVHVGQTRAVPQSATFALEKRMEQCFGSIPDRSLADSKALTIRSKRLRSISSDNDNAAVNGGHVSKFIKSGETSRAAALGTQPKSDHDLSSELLSWTEYEHYFDDVCPFSLYPNSACPWGLECELREVCTNKVRCPEATVFVRYRMLKLGRGYVAFMAVVRCTRPYPVDLWREGSDARICLVLMVTIERSSAGFPMEDALTT